MDVINPSLYQLKCPFCGNGSFIPLGVKRSAFKQFASGLSAGLAPVIATVVANAQAGNLVEVVPLEYQCPQCKKKYEFAPLPANTEEILDQYCTVHFERAKMFKGSAGVYTVYLNGVPVDNVRNGEVVSFLTNLRYNTIFVGFGKGIIYRDYMRFEAVSGGDIRVFYDGSFRFA